jgi:two-component system, CitB family, sensor kinase
MVRRFRLSLAAQLVVVQLILIVAVLVAVSAVSVEQTRAGFQRDEGRRILALAENLAANPVVRREPVETGGSALAAALAQVQDATGVESASVADTSGRVVASTDTLVIGETLTWPELAQAPMRSSSAILEIRGRSYLLAAAPILSNPTTTGEPVRQLGIALVAQPNPSRLDALATAAPALLTYLGAALLLGVLGSLLLARWIKRQTLGMEPAEIAALAEQREAIFAGIAEGVIALDTKNHVTLVNPLAQQLLSLPTHSVGLTLDELKIEGRLREVLTGQSGAEQDAVVIRSGRVLVLNRMPVRLAGRELGSVTTLRDRTQLAELERELGAFRGTTDLLRAQTHEFANQLHTISGLIQIGEYDEVVQYVNALTEGRAAVDLTVARRVHDRSVAALLVAQSAMAAERKVLLRVSERTHLDPLESSSAFDVATVLGNLVQNGIDAAASHRTAERDAWVEVEIRQSGGTVELVVKDSGPGVDTTIANEVFEHGFTTKAAQDGDRGIGLALTKLICRRRGGEALVRGTEAGAEFVARMTVTTAEPRPEPADVETPPTDRPAPLGTSGR